MPHLTLEYSANLAGLDVPAVLLALNQTLLASGEFAEPDIKSRALRFDHYAIGVEATPRAFVHVKLALLSGRSDALKRTLSEALLATLMRADACPAALDVQWCVEIQDIERAAYAKAGSVR